MSMNDFIQTIARRAKATSKLEKVAGGVTEATWAIESVAGYFERGGTLAGLHFAIGETLDADLAELADTAATAEEQPAAEEPSPFEIPQPPVPAEHDCEAEGCTVMRAQMMALPGLTFPELTESTLRRVRVDPADVLLDDQEELDKLFDAAIPSYLARVTTVAIEPMLWNQEARWLIGMVLDREKL